MTGVDATGELSGVFLRMTLVQRFCNTANQAHGSDLFISVAEWCRAVECRNPHSWDRLRVASE
jgi:hypothetical protein